MLRFTRISQTRQGQVGKKRGRQEPIRSGIGSLLTLATLALLWCQPPERLQINLQTHLDLVASGDIPEGGLAPCGIFRYGWAACDSRSSCSLEWFESCFGFWARWGGGSGYAFHSTLDITLPLAFRFTSHPPTLSIEGYTYTPKRSLGFLYFVQDVGVASTDLIAAASCGPYESPPPPCCATASSEAFFEVSVQTSLARASIADDFGASCACGDAANCADCGHDLNEPPYPYDGWHQGYRSHQVSFADGITAKHEEDLHAHLLLQAQGSLCAAAGGNVGGGAGAGLVVQSAPHPLGVPAIGGNEFVWSGGSPATLVIPARALGYTWGWEPDLSWIAEETVFRVEPEIPSDDTKPGERTVARGRELVAQSLEGQTGGYVDDLLYRSKHLPPHNSDFGKKRVVFEVEDKVDYAEIEVFYPTDMKNHPPGGPRGYLMPSLIDPCQPIHELSEPSPNWFYYYWDAYGRHEDVYFAKENTNNPRVFGRLCETYAAGCTIASIKIYIFDTVSPCSGYVHVLPLFRLEYRYLEPDECRDVYSSAFITRSDEELYVYGIHGYIETLEHELAHKRHFIDGILCFRTDRNRVDNDWDGLDDRWEIRHGLHPCYYRSVDPDLPDYEVIAYIEGYGNLLSAKEMWKHDWADDCGYDPCNTNPQNHYRYGGIQKACPPSPFPWRYVRDHRIAATPFYNDLLTKIPESP